MTDLYTGTDGFSITKYRNVTRSGALHPMLTLQETGLTLIFLYSVWGNLPHLCGICIAWRYRR